MIRPADRTVHVLLIEDDEEDYLITQDLLEGQDQAHFMVDWCPSFAKGIELIGQRRHDVYLIDYHLGPHTGLELVRSGFGGRAHAPVILLTGQSDYDIDLEATTLGVTDYLIKQELTPVTLERSIRYAISHHRALAELAVSEERYALAARGANDGIWDWDLVNDAMYLSPRWYEILGREEGPVEARPADLLGTVHPEDLPEFLRLLRAHLDGASPHLSVEHRIRTSDSEWRWMLTRGVAIRDPSGRPSRIAGSMSDVTERRAAVQRLRHDALHDALTGLPNRTLMLDRLEQALLRERREHEPGNAVLFLDVDRFKMVNDSLSHAVGDRLLVEVALRILTVVRPTDTVARLGGDEFTLLVEGVASSHEAMEVAERVQAVFNEPFEISGHVLRVTASVGIALSGRGVAATELLRDADIAMYAAKNAGRGGYALYDKSMRRRIVERLSREGYLRRAVEQELVGVAYQPIVELATGRIWGFEALARWPEGWPECEPSEFIPVAEEIGLIGALGSGVMHAALRDLSGWRAAGLVDEDVTMSVNISTRQLEDGELPQAVLRQLESSGLPPGALRLEITESSLMGEPTTVSRIVREMCDRGVGLHLDDFGTGYSSLSALNALPLRALKIDRSFVASMFRGLDGSETIVRSTVALAHSLGLAVIAEGIETAEQLDHLRALGCEAGQGFLLGRPIRAEEMERRLRTGDLLRAGMRDAAGAERLSRGRSGES